MFPSKLCKAQIRNLYVTLQDRMMDFHWKKRKLFLIYVVMGLNVAILRFLCVSTFSMLKTLKIQKNGKTYSKKISFCHENGTYT